MDLIDGVESSAIAVRDRGFAYGDGVFRTLKVRGGQTRQWQLHYAKLAADCAALRIDCPRAAVLERDLVQVIAGHSDCVIKITVTRGDNVRGYGISPATSPRRVVSRFPSPVYPEHYESAGIRVRMCQLRLAYQPALAGIKHLNRMENVLARSEWSDPSIAEGLLCDAEANLICATAANLFILKDGVLATPELARCGVAGVQRSRVLELAGGHGLDSRITTIKIADAYAADALFLVNSVIGIWQIAELEDRTWRPHSLITQIRNSLDRV